MTKGIDDIGKILQDYENEIKETMNDTFKKIAEESVEKLKSSSPRGKGKKHYADGWTAKETETGYVVYNKDKYQLTHLLEYGHAKRGGTDRVPAKPHIKPVEDWVIQNIESRLKNDIEN